jgi:hypothetical protein
MPAFPVEPVCLKNGLDRTLGEVVQIQRLAICIGKSPAECIFGRDGIEPSSERLDERNNAGVFIFVGLGPGFQVSRPRLDVKNVPIVILRSAMVNSAFSIVFSFSRPP